MAFKAKTREEWIKYGKNAWKKWRYAIMAVLVYIAFAAYYMGPSITACTDTVYGFGDNTAGPIWKYSLPGGQSPIGGFEDYTNHPYGENLYTPVTVSNVLQSTVLWGFAKVAGPVCGYNLMNLTGFVVSAAGMFGFIYWLTRNRWIALLAGYVVSFTPYFQYKVGGHPSYGYHVLLIGTVWLFFKLLKERRKRDAVFLGLVAGACFSWDPYFTLLMVSTLIPLGIAWLLYGWWSVRKATNPAQKNVKAAFVQQAKLLGISAAIIAVFMMPLVAVRISMSSQINNYVSGSRGNVMQDAMYCSILPWDHVLPADDNWFIGKFVAPSFSEKMRVFRHQCNPSEYNVGLSAAVLAVISLGLVIFIWEKVNGRRLFARKGVDHDYRFVMFALAAMIIFAAALAMPPTLGKLKFPFYYLLQLTDTWRIPNRLYLVINIGMTVLFAIVLTYAAQLKFFAGRKWRSIVALLLVFALIFAQYQAFAPLHGSRATFSYSKDMSQIYSWLKDQKDIHYIAAYP
ncbi:MAG: hypothetical protein JWL85_108, partial [Candidatus Saccharibacteria bacterium]|nr:hypothetical protein [Candidatus Saccharibacteria bacterium]